MRHDSQYPLRQAHYVSHSTDFANRAISKAHCTIPPSSRYTNTPVVNSVFDNRDGQHSDPASCDLANPGPKYDDRHQRKIQT